MAVEVNYIERKTGDTASIESVFRKVAEKLVDNRFRSAFQRVPFGNGLVGTLRNLLSFRPASADIYHVTGHVHYIALVLPPDRTVLTIHDLAILSSRQGIRRFVLKKLLFDWPVKRLRYLTVVSENTKRELITATNCPEHKIRVIENPLLWGFAEDEQTFDAECPTILQIGTAPNKNVMNLIKAVRSLRCRLRIIGPLNDEMLDALREGEIEYSNAVDLDREAMRSEYLNADIVAFCSTIEGFGIPITEAQAMLTPVITSDLSPMRDVAGGAAVLVDPYRPESIRSGLIKIIQNEQLRESLVAAGRENCRRFDPETVAAHYRELYDEILAAIH